MIQTVREKFTCRHCEKISQPPAPFHATPRGWAGPNLLAMIVFEKYGQHQPLNRQRDRYAREGVDLSLSTLADQVGACTVALRPLHDRIAAHVLAAERLHGDDTPVPVLAKSKTATARAWVYPAFVTRIWRHSDSLFAINTMALGRKSWLFAGSDRGGVRAAAMYTLIGTAKLNNVNPQAWLADVLDRIAGTPQNQLDELLPWNWQDSQRHDQAA